MSIREEIFLFFLIFLILSSTAFLHYSIIMLFVSRKSIPEISKNMSLILITQFEIICYGPVGIPGTRDLSHNTLNFSGFLLEAPVTIGKQLRKE